jgi:hypothetical protein
MVQTGRPHQLGGLVARTCADKEKRMAGTHIIRRALAPWLVLTTILGLLFLVPVAPAVRAASTAKFVSQRYGYSIVLPGSKSRWFVNLAVRNWTSGSIGGVDSPEFDKFSDLQTSRSYNIAAVPGTWTLAKWSTFATSARASICAGPQSLPNSTLGGAQARMFTWTCPDGYRIVAGTALHAHRGYFMLVISPIGLSRASDLNAFQVARRSFRFLTL